ncbi:N-acetylglucosamine-6-phosphate deacetylase [Paenarthrobacter ureafaciens]|uniref:N-acetylglucosamine-6-phosphate deacetylase n=1 Tax=Paenarthrobacter ureafaciens TaxID=37931 RepID=UPI003CE9C18D
MPENCVLVGTVLTDGNSAEDQAVAVVGGLITYVGPLKDLDRSSRPELEILEFPAGSMILPGLVDLHCHGGAGGDFPSGNLATARTAIDFIHRSGTTTLLASLVSASREDLLKGIATLRLLTDEGLIAGIHAEGPFLSHARCGAQDPRFLLHPDLDMLDQLLRAAGGHLRTMTYAPELPGAGALVRMLAEHGVVPSLGHTDSDAATAANSLTRAAELLASSGRTSPSRPTVTHLFNGMPPLHHRSPGPVAACLRLAADGQAAVELIADGAHLDAETVRMVFAIAGGANVILVTDSMAAAGLPDGEYTLGPASVSVTGSVARVRSNGSLAGGTASLLEIVRRTVEAGIDPVVAVTSATAVPAAVIGVQDRAGSLKPGRPADLVVVDSSFHRLLVLRGGRCLPP